MKLQSAQNTRDLEKEYKPMLDQVQLEKDSKDLDYIADKIAKALKEGWGNVTVEGFISQRVLQIVENLGYKTSFNDPTKLHCNGTYTIHWRL